jgi:hypothetical protein
MDKLGTFHLIQYSFFSLCLLNPQKGMEMLLLSDQLLQSRQPCEQTVKRLARINRRAIELAYRSGIAHSHLQGVESR